MTQPTGITSIIEAFKIPAPIMNLPEFDGNRRDLYNFIANVDEIINCVETDWTAGFAKMWIRAIRNKIKGEANEVLNMFGTPTDWDTIKANLITHYADKRNETTLIRDLHNLRQNSNQKLEEFYAQVIEILSALINFTKINESNASSQKSKLELFRNLAKDVFLAGLREPIGSVVRARNPDTIQNAYDYAIKEQNIHYHQKSYNTPSVQNKPNSNLNSGFRPKQIIQYPQQMTFRQPYQQPQFNQAIRPQFSRTQAPQFQPSYPNTNSTQITQYRPNQNRQFSSPLNRPVQNRLPNPTPMDLGSTQSQMRTNQFKPTNQNSGLYNIESPDYSSLDKYVEELPNTNNTFDANEYYYDENPQQYENIDDENFQFNLDHNSDT